jgi:hypothetical protein
MEIELHRIKIGKVVKNYKDSQEEGVTGYDGKLNIRPKYQREFVYTGKQRESVLKTVRNNFPLNSMYWMIREDGGYEVLDGQQRTISIAQYVNNEYSIDGFMFHSLTKGEQEFILNYELMIYFCSGTDKERLDWFQTINIAGEKLTDQEIRNAVYTGPWLTDAKSRFSKTQCVAYLLANENGQLISGKPIRQDYLEKVLNWISDGQIREYMSLHQHDSNADDLWNYFKEVIFWVNKMFVNYRDEMKNVEWGNLFNKFKDTKLNPNKLEEEISKLMQDEDVTKKSGIYNYIFTKEEKWLNIRKFSDNIKRETYEKQNGNCKNCKNHFSISQMESDHIDPWSKGGKTISSNCQLLCVECNRRKSDI